MFYSQFGEDKRLAAEFPENYMGVAIEVGASDGVYNSNTKHFEDKGWETLCIEPNPLYEVELGKNRKDYVIGACGSERLHSQDFTIYVMEPKYGLYGAVSSLKPDPEQLAIHEIAIKDTHMVKVEVYTLDELLAERDYPVIDIVSIDAEGCDMDVLKGFDTERWKPRFIIIENWRSTPAFLMHLRSYTYFDRMEVNDIYERTPE